MIVKASIGFLNNETAPAVANQTDIVIDAMTVAKSTFATPVPSLADVTAANAALRVAINEAADGSREKCAIKRAKLAELTSLMRQLANYVTSTCNGDMAKLLSSGFPRQKPTRDRIGQLTTPETPKVKQDEYSGQMTASVGLVYGASAYNWRLALASAPNTYVETAQTVSARVTFKGLTPGQLYNVECNAVGAAGPSNWSTAGQLRVI